MFQFTGLSSHILFIQMQMLQHYLQRVAPFGDPRVLGYFHLSEAYRR